MRRATRLRLRDEIFRLMFRKGSSSRDNLVHLFWAVSGRWAQKIDLFPVCARVEFYFSPPGRDFF